MTSHRYTDPDLILLEIPGTGAETLRTQLGPAAETRLASAIAAPGTPCLAMIRHPVARLQAVVAQFRTPRTQGDAPRLPGLTLAGALDIVENPRAPLDHSRSYPQAQLKAALAPQTHPIHHLHTATHVLRAEDPGPENARLAKALGLPPLPGPGPTLPEPVARADLARIAAAYSEDFARLGYHPDRPDPVAPPCLPVDPGPQAWDLWPAFFEWRDIRVEAAVEALPSPGGPLDPFARTLTGGRRGETWAGREANLIRHFRKLQPEFADQSRLAHLLGCTITVLRRVPDCTEAEVLFHEITESYAPKLASEMKLRWLVSVCDSFADHGRSQAQRAMGIAGSLLANTLKLTETERLLYDVPRPWPPQRRWGNGGPLFDGVISYWVEKGEMIALMSARLESVCAGDPQAGPFTREILRRAHRHNTVYRRLAALAGQTAPPLLDADLRSEIGALIDELL